jgi:Mn2+/Fe2+ NRAMP family transporter
MFRTAESFRRDDGFHEDSSHQTHSSSQKQNSTLTEMTAFILIVLLSFGTSILVYRQTRQNFSVIFLVIFLMLFSSTEKRIQKNQAVFTHMQSALQFE